MLIQNSISPFKPINTHDLRGVSPLMGAAVLQSGHVGPGVLYHQLQVRQ